MTNSAEQPSKLDRIEARLDQLVIVTEALVQTTTIHQQNFEQLVVEINADRQHAAQDRQAWLAEIRADPGLFVTSRKQRKAKAIKRDQRRWQPTTKLNYAA